MEDAVMGKPGVDVSVVDRESEALDTSLENWANLLEKLANRLAPVLLVSPQPEGPETAVCQTMSPLCSRISGWRSRIETACGCVNKLLEELET